MKILSQNSQGLQKLYNRHLYAHKKHVDEKVRRIIEDVRINGDEALIKYTKKYDKAKLKIKQLKVIENEISGSFQNITSDFIAALKAITHNVSLFYKKQNHKPCRVRDDDGVLLKENIHPLEAVGIYVPAGTAPLVSTVYMTVIPAKEAGVKRIVIVTPPDKNGQINPYILAVANLLKVNEIYKVGGAQAIAALAFGTKTIPRVDKIIGPGNMFVTEAKRQLFGFVDIDMLAGPSELVIIANRHSNPNYIIADLEGQLEHAGGLAVLVTTSRQIIKQIRKKVNKGYIIYAKNIEEAVDIVNRIAPEHVQILTNNPESIAKKIRNAGAIFLGPYSPTALGDYAAGPSHVLPTMGSARFFSGLGLSDFMKKSHIISYSKRALEKIKDPIERIATIEGLTKHSESINARFSATLPNG
ncbi:MAG TPA: histidinol dehydrogenase [Candidatus Omnitrophica bacterium]|nr:MAG: histidinol dehydrogenase [Omnitrophica WOR_2 bacterium GWA2_45_18]OGX18559.1 MAG: histidinol dehydrogenase [Omnitrophica WOR_2 bacterium GWC2_45_7]HBR15480.1 histidinol dehydrogenase [Candidatus Omnitrophota bacterium]